MESYQRIGFLKNYFRIKSTIIRANHFDILRSIAFVKKIELIVKGCLEHRAALTYELQIIQLLDLNPNIEHVPMEKKHLKLLVQINWLFPR